MCVISQDDDIYDDPSSNDINFKKLREKFQQQDSQDVKTKPVVKQKPRESVIAQRIKHLQASEVKTLQGRESVVSILPPHSGPLPPKTSKKVFKPLNNNAQPAIPAKKTSPGKVQVLPDVSGVKLKPIPKKATDAIAEESKPTSFSKANTNSKRISRPISQKENSLPDGLTVGMIVKGNDGKSYKLLPLPPKSGHPPPRPPVLEDVDLSRWMEEDGRLILIHYEINRTYNVQQVSWPDPIYSCAL